MEITKILKKHDQTERKANKRYQASRFAPVFKDDPSVFKDNEKLGIIDLASEIRNKICTFAGQHAKGKSAWQSAFFLKEVRVELSGEAASVKCSPPEIPLAPAQLMQSCNILFSLIVNLDSSVVIKCDPPIHPTFINEWDAKRRQFAVDHGGIRSFTERQTTVYY
ncbi:hypothetical protein KC331_g1156 [Hortaea werneckii]|nr:hypothetical protein KC331_g1156 [Hortaea werneckii]KAI7722585.1 hypothetical protein KC353_g378 [Hortaea werneckii]